MLHVKALFKHIIPVEDLLKLFLFNDIFVNNYNYTKVCF